MELKKCIIGMIIETNNGEIGFISGLCYDVSSPDALNLLALELPSSKGDHTILEITFPDSKKSMHPSNVEKLETYN